MELKRVVVTGLGAVTPVGNTTKDFWDALLAGKSGSAPITHFDASKFKTRFACEVKNFDPSNFIDRKEVRKMDRFTHYGVVAADEAIISSGINSEDLDKDRIGVIFSSGIGGLSTFEEQMKEYFSGDGTPRFNPFFIPKMIIDICAGHISMRYNFRGPNFAVVSACASSTNGIFDAFNYIRLGYADAIVTGGADGTVTEGGVGGFNAMKALSERNDDYLTASRPFDRDRDGFVLGEGAGALVLESLEHAKKRGAKILAEVVGGGATADAHHLTAPHPEGLGAKNVMKNALHNAGIQPSDIDYINVHGTSTMLGDRAELIAIKSVFGDQVYNLNISSTKSMTGHLVGAAGAIETIACIQAVMNDIAPPTINQFNIDEEIDSKLNLTPNKSQNRKIRYALSNTFGFGGHNASIIVKKFED